MSRQAEGDAVIVRGVLEGNRSLEWRPTETRTIYVGSDERCQWRITAPGVAAFHWQLCWYGNRLWMAEVGVRQGAIPGVSYWTMAPIGAVLRLGSAGIVLETDAPAPGGSHLDTVPTAPIRPRLPGSSHPTLPLHMVATGPSSARGIDPDATLLVDADELRALVVQAPPSPPRSAAAPDRPQVLSRAAAPWSGAPAIEEMFIVPAEPAAPPPARPSPLARWLAAGPLPRWLAASPLPRWFAASPLPRWFAAGPVARLLAAGPVARLLAIVPARVLIALLVTGGTAALTLLPESLHANRDQNAAVTAPPRRPPPESEIEVRAVQPDPTHSAAEAGASRDLAAGRLEEALRGYRDLAKAAPEDPVFRDFVTVIERRMKARARCTQGDCAQAVQEEEAK